MYVGEKKIELLYAITFVHFILSDSKFNARHASFYRIKNIKFTGVCPSSTYDNSAKKLICG